MISIYSVVTAVFLYNVCLAVVFILRRGSAFMARYATSTMVFLTTLAVIRLFSPVDLDAAYVIESDVILPAVIELLENRPGGFPLTIGECLIAIWITGSAISLVRVLRREILGALQRNDYIYVDNAQAQKVADTFKGKYTVKVTPSVNEPHVAGLFKPVIYIPDISLNDEDIRYILMHEIQHIRHFDLFKRVLFLAIDVLFWWNPLAHISLEETEQLIEIQCDSRVTAKLDERGTQRYLETIFKIIKLLNTEDKPAAKKPLISAFAQGDFIKQRFEIMILRDKYKQSRLRYLLWILVLALFIMSYFVVIQPYYDCESYAGEVLISTQNSYVLHENGKYYLSFDGCIIGELTEEQINTAPYNQFEIIGGK